ncbi:multidrug efflux SMR transporter [Bacillus sp. FJAT-50079]|uniref:DMT family transporter n=1 Tax=Bacillus sp. FJAT-50079 TaxID=2833577 RepID=UPI0020167095|nr:multidrug efflux SMR transporter [Bacillus sp. FJAT-50079]
MKGFIFLSISITTEIIATMLLKLSNGFTVILPTIGVIIGYGLAFYFLSKSLEFIPLSIAYAIWSGVGTALTAILGIIFFSDPINLGVVLGILSIIFGVVMMNVPNVKKAKN